MASTSTSKSTQPEKIPLTVTVKMLNGDIFSLTIESHYRKRDIEIMVAHQYNQDLESVRLTLLEQNYYLGVFKDPCITVSVDVLKYEYTHSEMDEPVYHIVFYQYDKVLISYKVILKDDDNGLSFALADSFYADWYDDPNGNEICYYKETNETQWFSSPAECIASDLHPRLNQDNISLLADEIMDKLLTTRLQNPL